MAITIRKPAAAADPVPATTLQGLLAEQTTKFDQSKEVMYCVHSSHTTGYQGLGVTYSGLRKGNVVHSVLMTEITGKVFQHMQTAAFAGNAEVTLTIPAGRETSPAITVAVLEFLRDRMGVRMHNCDWPDPRRSQTHSTFCDLQFQSLDLTISWENMNPYLNPKPLLQLPDPEVWGTEKLNQERLQGNGDFKLVFGNGHAFSVHRLVVKSFSPMMDSMLSSGMKETGATVLTFPDATCSEEALETLITLMYTRKIDFSKLAPSVAIELLEVGFFFLSDALKCLALTHLYEVGEKLSSLDRLNLSFLQTRQPSESLKQLCDWLVKIEPTVYERILEQEIVSTEELFKLFAVAVDFKIEPLKVRLQMEWDKLGTAQKTAFVERALGNGEHLHILEATAEFCKETLKTIGSKDADKPGFVAIYKRLNAQIVDLNTK